MSSVFYSSDNIFCLDPSRIRISKKDHSDDRANAKEKIPRRAFYRHNIIQLQSVGYSKIPIEESEHKAVIHGLYDLIIFSEQSNTETAHTADTDGINADLEKRR